MIRFSRNYSLINSDMLPPTGGFNFTFKGVLLCFFTFWILVSVKCVCLGIKRSTKLQTSKSTPKGDISFLNKSLFKNYNERLIWTTGLFSGVCDITKINPAYGNSNGGVGRTLGWALHVCTPLIAGWMDDVKMDGENDGWMDGWMM